MTARRTRRTSPENGPPQKKLCANDKSSGEESELSALDDSSLPSSETDASDGSTPAAKSPALAKTAENNVGVVTGVQEASEAPYDSTTSSVPTHVDTNLSSAKADFDGPSWLSCEQLEQIRTYLDFSDASSNRFAVACIPPDAAWGDKFKGRDVSRYLCADGKPLTAWFTGTTVSMWFQDFMGNPHDKVNIGVGFLRKVDNVASSFWASKTHPVKSKRYLYIVIVPTLTRVEVGGDVVYARRFMTQWEENAEKPTVIPFTQMFDATSGMRKKSDMPRKYPKGIPKGSVVVVEAALTRYKTGVKVAGRWDDWNTIWELLSVNLVAANVVRPAQTDDDFFANAEEEEL